MSSSLQMRGRWLLSSLGALATLVSCGGRVALYNNVPGVGGGTGVAGGAGVAGAAGAVGAAGAAGAPVDPRTKDVDAVWPGAGCGKMLPDNQNATVTGSPKGYTQFTVTGTGANLTDTPIAAKAGPRTFWVRVPANYDPNRPYRVVYLGQGCGGYRSANTSTYQLYKESAGGTEQAIYVALDIPEDMVNYDCYDDQSGLQSQEWESFELFMEFVDAHYCVDLNKIYVAGYSTGGWLANMWGCYFSGWPSPARKFAPTYHVRAQAAYSGGEPDVQPACGGPVAGFWLHDVNDNGSPISGSFAALARVGHMNGCDTTLDDTSLQTAWHGDDQRIGPVCRRFAGCPGDYPVVFCETMGLGQASQDFRMIPALKYFFDEVESAPGRDGGATAGADAGACVPECALGTFVCGANGGLEGCVLDVRGCPVRGGGYPCGPGRTCGATSPSGGFGCVRDPSCPVVPDGCTAPGTFCLDANTIATCAISDVASPTGSQCLKVEYQFACTDNQTCVTAPWPRCQ